MNDEAQDECTGNDTVQEGSTCMHAKYAACTEIDLILEVPVASLCASPLQITCPWTRSRRLLMWQASLSRVLVPRHVFPASWHPGASKLLFLIIFREAFSPIFVL